MNGCSCSENKTGKNTPLTCCSQKIGEPAITRITSAWKFSDWLGSILVRFGWRRLNDRVAPGLYTIGEPNAHAPVFVSANYKLSFDHLRRGLAETPAYILVLDTKGVNVWCAAGKKSFSTTEVIARIRSSGLCDFVSHREIILPQLGAPGVRGFEITRETGFRVLYGPVRTADIHLFLKNGKTADRRMRTVRFDLIDRIKVIPIEVIFAGKWFFIPILLAFTLGWFGIIPPAFIPDYLLPLVIALILGTVAFPILLPLLPFRAFSLKGWILGVLGLTAYGWLLHRELFEALTLPLLFAPVTAFFALNFTGASTFTSLSGVKKETTRAIPMMIVSCLLGLVAAIWL